jgi:membrane protein required for colicin V production
MNYFDLTFLLAASFITIRGLFRGLISELMVLVAIIFGFILATFFHPYLQNIVLHFLPDLPVALVKIVSFIVIFIGVNILVRILGGMLNKIATFTFLQPVNKVAGAVFAFLKITLIFSILIIVVELIPGAGLLMESIGSKESITYNFVKEFGPFLYNIFFGGSDNSFKDIIPFNTLSLTGSLKAYLV